MKAYLYALREVWTVARLPHNHHPTIPEENDQSCSTYRFDTVTKRLFVSRPWDPVFEFLQVNIKGSGFGKGHQF